MQSTLMVDVHHGLAALSFASLCKAMRARRATMRDASERARLAFRVAHGCASRACTLVEYQADISGVYERRPDKVFISLIRVFWPDMALISTISLVKKTRIRLIKTLSGRRS